MHDDCTIRILEFRTVYPDFLAQCCEYCNSHLYSRFPGKSGNPSSYHTTPDFPGNRDRDYAGVVPISWEIRVGRRE
eukprot:g36710.t1